MIEKIFDGFSIGNYNLDILSTIPVIKHAYGDNTVIPDELCWMTYKNALDTGSISFTRNTSKYLPELTEYITQHIQQYFKFQLNKDRVHFIRTTGNVGKHRDEANRKCCLNIGLKNSSTAVTKVYHLDNLVDCLECRCEDGAGYLLDTSKIHEVIGNEERLLITYGFGYKFNTIKEYLCKDENTHLTITKV